MAAYEKAAIMHQLRAGEGAERAIYVKEAHGRLERHVPRYDRSGVYPALEQAPDEFLVIENRGRFNDERKSEPARVDISGGLRKSDLSLP
jgi:sarcosine oxidase gamma subunit